MNEYKKLRTKLHLTQKQFADLIGINVKTVSAYEVGRIQGALPVIRRMKKLAIEKGIRWNVL